MKLTKQLSKNSTELVMGDSFKVLFSYANAVASMIDGRFYITEKRWSKTTLRHIDEWLDKYGVTLNGANIKEQDFFDTIIHDYLKDREHDA